MFNDSSYSPETSAPESEGGTLSEKGDTQFFSEGKSNAVVSVNSFSKFPTFRGFKELLERLEINGTASSLLIPAPKSLLL
jgi:hypothetical protein